MEEKRDESRLDPAGRCLCKRTPGPRTVATFGSGERAGHLVLGGISGKKKKISEGGNLGGRFLHSSPSSPSAEIDLEHKRRVNRAGRRPRPEGGNK